MRLPLDMVELRSDDLRLRVRLGEGDVVLSGGVGGHESVVRPGRRPLIVWRGFDQALSLTLPLLFDEFDEGRAGHSVEGGIRTLEKLSGLGVAGDPAPPELTVNGALPHDLGEAPQNRWVVNELEWGEYVRRRSDGKRVRQAVTVTLVLKPNDDRIRTLRGSKGKGRYRFVRAKKGDTYEKIAARELNLRRLGRRLAKLNGGRSADVKLKEGKRVKLPRGELLKDWKRDAPDLQGTARAFNEGL